MFQLLKQAVQEIASKTQVQQMAEQVAERTVLNATMHAVNGKKTAWDRQQTLLVCHNFRGETHHLSARNVTYIISWISY